MVSNASVYRCLDLFYETNARWCKGAMGFGKSKAKLLTEHRDKVTFKMLQVSMKLKQS